MANTGEKTAKVLILTLPHGAAHRRAASALEKALVAIQPKLRVTVVDALQYCTSWFRAYYRSYELPLRYWPSLWGWIEGIQHQSNSTGPRWLYRSGAQPLLRFIQSFDPDVVVATEVGLGELASLLKRETHARFRLVGLVLMDFNRAWVQPEFDLYPSAPGDPAAQLEAAGVPREKIFPCGIPIDPVFATLSDRGEVRARLGVDPGLPLVLALFGGAGYGKPRRILNQFMKVEQPFQATFVTGKNEQLEQKTRTLCQGLPHFRVLGWVDNMHEWMWAADLLVSKPGGVTLVEAMSCRLPLLALDPLPGNEQRTCAWIEKWQVGHWIKQPDDLAPTMARLLANGEELERLREQAFSFARPHAAKEVARAIMNLLTERPQPTTRSG